MAEGESDELLLEQPEGEEQEQGSEVQTQEGEEEELEVTFGDGAAPAPGERDTDLVRHLRDEIRRRDKMLAEASKSQPAPRKVEVGQRPTLEGCDFDEDRFTAEFEAWQQRKAEAERAETEAERAEREVRESWQRELQSHEAKRAALKFPDVQETEETVTAALNEVQQAVIVKVADNSALLLYSLGKHPAKLAELSQITDPLKMAAAVARLEGGLKVMPKRRAPDPEEVVSGNAGVSRGADKTLAKLEAEAERTGDRTKLIQYRKQRKAEGK